MTETAKSVKYVPAPGDYVRFSVPDKGSFIGKVHYLSGPVVFQDGVETRTNVFAHVKYIDSEFQLKEAVLVIGNGITKVY